MKKIVTAAIILNESRVLIGRRKPNQALGGYWEFPGGKVENGESLVDCLKRELQEELGVNAKVSEDIFMLVDHTYDGGEIQLIAMLADIGDQQPVGTVHDFLAWAPIEELSSYKLAPADL
ncbi:MAG: (deoxy)nucleoside triphosphate pyrophosphohydrolase, partial [Polynucleobacter victoriensis]